MKSDDPGFESYEDRFCKEICELDVDVNAMTRKCPKKCHGMSGRITPRCYVFHGSFCTHPEHPLVKKLEELVVEDL